MGSRGRRKGSCAYGTGFPAAEHDSAAVERNHTSAGQIGQNSCTGGIIFSTRKHISRILFCKSSISHYFLANVQLPELQGILENVDMYNDSFEHPVVPVIIAIMQMYSISYLVLCYNIYSRFSRTTKWVITWMSFCKQRYTNFSNFRCVVLCSYEDGSSRTAVKFSLL